MANPMPDLSAFLQQLSSGMTEDQMVALFRQHAAMFTSHPTMDLGPYVTKNPGSAIANLKASDFRLKLTWEMNMDFVSESCIIPLYVPIMVTDRDSDEEKKIGEISGWIVQRSRMQNEGHDFQEACDDESHELMMVASTLFDEDGEFIETHECRFATECIGDILYINTVVLDEDYRGAGLGLLAVAALIRSLPSFEMDTILLHPAPATGHVRDHDKESIGRAEERLAEHWSLLGFERIGDTNYMGLWTGFAKPHIQRIVPHLF